MQLLRPATRHKLRVLQNPKALAEYLQATPAFLGGECCCSVCSGGGNDGSNFLGLSYDQENEQRGAGAGEMVVAMERGSPATVEQVARMAVVGMLMVWIFLAYMVGMKDADGGGALLFFS